MSTTGADYENMRLMARVLTLYYEEGRNQSQVATELGLSTAKVNRLIKQAKELGYVEIKVNTPFQTVTGLEDRLRSTFGLQDAEIPNWQARTKVDTIFMVTDGVPTTGKITDVPRLIHAVTDLNRTRGVIIHVIVFDKQEGVKLGPLAKRNGGQCVVRGWTGK